MRVYHGDPIQLAAPKPALSLVLLAFVEKRYGLRAITPRELGGGFNLNTNVVAVLDFDFMGVRPRIDDLALPLHTVLQTGTRPADVRGLVDAYDSGCATPLSDLERRALPFAMARMSLSYLQYLVLPGDEQYALRCRREFNEKRGPACEWWLDAMRDAAFWESFA